MSQSVDNIIPIDWTIKRGGLGAISFGVALAAYGDADKPEDQGAQYFYRYEDVLEKHPTRTELLDVAKNWFGSGGAKLITFGYKYVAPAAGPESADVQQPAKQVKEAPKVALEQTEDDKRQEKHMEALRTSLGKISAKTLAAPSSFLEAIMAAADKDWFYFPFSTQTPTALTPDELEEAVQWCDANSRFFMYTESDDKAKDPTVSDDNGAYLVSLGYRRCAAGYSKQDPYIGVRVAAMMSMVDYMAPRSYKDAEYKSVNVPEDDLSQSDIMTLKTKGYFFNTEIASKASNTGAMLQNTMSTSQYGETIAEVMATDSYLINLQTSLLNAVTSQKNLPQTPDGESIAINAADQMGEIYIDNTFLGERQIQHPVTKETVITRGYITTTKPEDIYKLTDGERAEHKLYPIEQYIYRSGSAWTVKATVNVW